MRKHTKIYLDYFGYTTADFIPCELCGSKAVDVHHIDCKGMGGSKSKDYIENLQAVCRRCHELYGDKTEYKDFLKHIHLKKLNNGSISN